MNQPDYAGEIAQLRAATPDAIYFFLPGSMAINFIKQYSAAHVGIPLYSGNSVEEATIHAMGANAVGAFSAAIYGDDLDTPENKAFVAAYQEHYHRRPSVYAETAYDAVTFLDIAVHSVGGDISRKDDIRAALEKATPTLARGPFRFNTNHFPIQNVYSLQVVKEGDDVRMHVTGKIFEGHDDVYAKDCKM
jgi:branched-chain amino acid transport system substrate-binding protein